MSVTPSAERGYANPELLADSDWLARHLSDPHLRVIDARSANEYAAGHIPGAVHLDGFASIPRAEDGEMADPEVFARLASGLGIGDGTTVVVYDAPSQRMGMVAWAFQYYGHPDTRILDGGFAKWMGEGRAVSTETPTYPPAEFTPRPVEAIYCSLDSAKGGFGQPSTVFWDTRSLAEYDGTVTAGGSALARPGRIPGAVHLEWTELFDPETKTLKPANVLQDLLVSRGITPESVVNTY